MQIPLDMIPEEIMVQYNLGPLIHNGCVYVKIQKGMYGLHQAGRIANAQLQDVLALFGFHPVQIIPGFWRHNSQPVSFCLVVDNFL